MKKIHSSTDAAREIERDELSLGAQQVTSLAAGTSLAAITGTAELVAGILSGKFDPHPSIAPYQSLLQELAKKTHIAQGEASWVNTSLSPYLPHADTVEYRIGGPVARHSLVAESVHKALVPEDQDLRDFDIRSALFSATCKALLETVELPNVSSQTSEPRFNVELHRLEGFDSSGLEVDDEKRAPGLPDWPATMRKEPYAL